MHKPLKASFGAIFPQAGCDEAGRGCLAGPVYAAAVILPENPNPMYFKNLDDSKKLSGNERKNLSNTIKKKAISWGIASVDVTCIDEINILNASLLAMHKALEILNPQPAFVLVDGNRFKNYKSIPHACLVKGDAHYLSIAAASILAKTARDDYMEQLHIEYPVYNWNTNKGYPTPAHREAIARYGLSAHHRLSFRQYAQMRIAF